MTITDQAIMALGKERDRWREQAINAERDLAESRARLERYAIDRAMALQAMARALDEAQQDRDANAARAQELARRVTELETRLLAP